MVQQIWSIDQAHALALKADRFVRTRKTTKTTCPHVEGSSRSHTNRVKEKTAPSQTLARLANGEGGLWLQIIRNKYLHGQPIAFCLRTGGSQFWQSVIQLLPVLRIGTSITVGSRTATLFWFDRWAGDSPFGARFPDLFYIAVEPRISVETALIDLGRFVFRRPFGPPEIAAWHELLEAVAHHEPDLAHPHDRLSWRLEPSGRFSTKSLYQAIAPSPGPAAFEIIWAIRVPLKIKIFLWQWIRGRLPSGVEC